MTSTLAEGDDIQDALIKKTEQETVPNIFIKQQHIGRAHSVHGKEGNSLFDCF